MYNSNNKDGGGEQQSKQRADIQTEICLYSQHRHIYIHTIYATANQTKNVLTSQQALEHLIL